MEVPSIVGIFIFISRENFMLSSVEHEKSFITLGPRKIKQHNFALILVAYIIDKQFNLERKEALHKYNA